MVLSGDYEPGGRRFESFRARHTKKGSTSIEPFAVFDFEYRIRTSDSKSCSTSAGGTQNGRRPLIPPGAPYFPKGIKRLPQLRGGRFAFQHYQCRTIAGLSVTDSLGRLDQVLQFRGGIMCRDVAVTMTEQDVARLHRHAGCPKSPTEGVRHVMYPHLRPISLLLSV